LITGATRTHNQSCAWVVFAGGGEELNWSLTMLFDAMGALSSKYNENPTQASRAFDVDRDGFPWYAAHGKDQRA
jgi:3-oxoacyl-(acyl-carrier-protein) synthase